MQILAVDGGDKALVSQFARLREAGYDVTQAATFEAARKILLSRDDHVDLLVTGLRLSAYNGLHLVSYTQSFCADTAAIVVDGAADPLNELEAHRVGAAYLAAPVEAEQLRVLVEAAITSRAHQALATSRSTVG